MLTSLIDELRLDANSVEDEVVRQSIIHNISLTESSPEYSTYLNATKQFNAGDFNDTLLAILLYDHRLKPFVDQSDLKEKYDRIRIANMHFFKLGGDIPDLDGTREEIITQLKNDVRSGRVFDEYGYRSSESAYLKRAILVCKRLAVETRKTKGNTAPEASQLDELANKMRDREGKLMKMGKVDGRKRRKPVKQQFHVDVFTVCILIIAVAAAFLLHKDRYLPRLNPKDEQLLSLISDPLPTEGRR